MGLEKLVVPLLVCPAGSVASGSHLMGLASNESAVHSMPYVAVDPAGMTTATRKLKGFCVQSQLTGTCGPVAKPGALES